LVDLCTPLKPIPPMLVGDALSLNVQAEFGNLLAALEQTTRVFANPHFKD